MDHSVDRIRFKRSASGITLLSHLFGVLSVILILIWLLHYREGIELDSRNALRVFNLHPFLMFSGFIFIAGEAMMAYKTVPGTHDAKKFVHMLLNLIAVCLGIIGFHAVFKFHDMLNLRDMTSLHSWLGMGTFCLFILQWLFGLSAFMFPKSNPETRARALPWHISGGRALLYMAMCTAETGLMQKASFLQLQNNSNELYLINFLGLAILLFGITVDLSVALARYI